MWDQCLNQLRHRSSDQLNAAEVNLSLNVFLGHLRPLGDLLLWVGVRRRPLTSPQN